MSFKYHYDEHGVTFNYFVLTVLGLILIPATIKHYLLPSKANSTKAYDCGCPACLSKKQLLKEKEKQSKWPLVKLSLFIFGWLVFAYMAKGLLTTSVENLQYDPYAILGLDSSASEEVVKKTFKKLSLQFHPDKAKDVEGAADKFVTISKAYQALTDPEIRKNWEEYGNPDGIRSFDLGIALPAWLVAGQNSFLVLGIYGLIFGVGLPILVGRWWSRSKKYSKDGILHETMALFYKEMNDNMTVKKIVELLSAASEFKGQIPYKPTDEAAISELLEKMQRELSGIEAFEKSRKYNGKEAHKAHVLLYAHFHRIPVDNSLQSDLRLIVERAAHLVLGMIQICTARDWLNSGLNCMTLSQMIIAGMWENSSAMLQLPYIDKEILKHCKTKKRNVRNPKDFLALDKEEQKSLLRDLSETQLAQVASIAREFPQISVPKVVCKILGQPKITTDGLITCQIKLAVRKLGDSSGASPESSGEFTDITKEQDGSDDDNLEIDEDGEISEKRAIAPKGPLVNPNAPIHAPYFPADKRPCWWVFLGSRGSNFLSVPNKIFDLEREKTISLQFKAPPKPMTVSLLLHVKSDCIMGIDLVEEVKFNVVAASELPQETFEDEISGDEAPNVLNPFGEDDGVGMGAPSTSGHSHAGHGGGCC